MIDHGPVWYPFTQHATEPTPPLITHSQGVTLFAQDGRHFIDAISSWWVITHGHREPHLMAAIRAATEKTDQIIFAGLTHEYAEQLARILITMAPPGLEHVFYSDSGSTCVEVGLKMALGYHRHCGTARSRIAVLEHGYHGDTIGTMSVGARGVFNAPYDALLFDVETLPFPRAGQEHLLLEHFEALASRRELAALVIEPLILGAGGMLMYPAWVLRELKEIAQRTGTLLIADEVMTGWGRTGTLFACEQAGIAPDILCTSKGLTGGALPLAATLATAPIFEAHYSQDRRRTFFHSSSYTANPIACATALANTQLWQTGAPLRNAQNLAKMQESALQRFQGDPRFTSVRRTGTITALDLRVPDSGYLAESGPRLRAFCLEHGVLLRPLGNTLYIMPPYCITETELAHVYATIDQAADHLMTHG